MDKLLIVIGRLATTSLILFLTAITFHSLWYWFVVPIGLNAISYANAYGLVLIVAYFNARNLSRRKLVDEVIQKQDYWQRTWTIVGINLGALIIGYITSLFM